MWRSRLIPDAFTLAMLVVVAAASLWPVQGGAAQGLEALTTAAIAALFFLHGARLSRAQVLAGLGHWRLHAVVLACTFGVFPVVGWLCKPLFAWALTPALAGGMLFLCALPATVQSAIAFTSIARGNVAAAVCSASASSVIGVVLTPVWVGLMGLAATGADAGHGMGAGVLSIMQQLLLPFVLGQCLQPLVGAWVARHAAMLKRVDQGSILLVVYTAFCAAVAQGLWHAVPWDVLLRLTLVCAALLACVLVATCWASRRLGFSKEDEITIVFGASKKSLASGVPMAKVLFAAPQVGMMLLPIMLFHQMQLMVCAILAQRYGQRAP
ncbi:MAG: bile acid:sodium symporter [Rhodoferax sp.]|nr:bile acid:sodium symporter [Rhodoferax sp.]